MFFFCDYVLAFMHNLEIKISVSAFAAFVSFHFGASEYLLVLVQYLLFADFVLGVFRAKKNKRFSWFKAWVGIKKIISLYFGILIVGFACKAFDITVHRRITIEYNGTFWFDLFLCILIILNLASINHHLAGFGFGINQFIDRVFFRYRSRLQQKIEGEINRVLGSEYRHKDK